jgi:hypothetical protein
MRMRNKVINDNAYSRYSETILVAVIFLTSAVISLHSHAEDFLYSGSNACRGIARMGREPWSGKTAPRMTAILRMVK